jgi:L-ascorbate metabolism protein UlaG (beta-lactamase superfamily)
MRVTWHGHSFFELESGGTTVLIDPFLEGNPGTEATPEDFDADVIAVTHGHHDHAGDAPLFDAPVVCQPELAEYYADRGVEATGMNVGGTYEGFGVGFTMTKAFHSSGAPDDADFDRYAGTPAGFVVADGGTRFYHAGDTSLFGDMRAVVREVYEPDTAAVPIGDHFTMGPSDAATAVGWLGVDDAFPMHYDTFPPIEQDPAEFAEAVGNATTHLPEPGETVVL